MFAHNFGAGVVFQHWQAFYQLLNISALKSVLFVWTNGSAQSGGMSSPFISGSFPSFSSCKFSLSGMLMGNVILFLFAAVLLFWFCLSGMENSTSLRVGVLSTGHLAIAHIFLILITWWQGNQKGTIFQLNFSFQFNNSEKKKRTKLIDLAVWWDSQCDSWLEVAFHFVHSLWLRRYLGKGQINAYISFYNKLHVDSISHFAYSCEML